MRVSRAGLRPVAWALLAAGLSVYVLAAYRLGGPIGATDFDQVWYAARVVQRGGDPYATIVADGTFPFQYYYPGTATFLALPFGYLDLWTTRLVFVAVSGAVFGLAIGRYRPELWPVLFGVPFLLVGQNAQWSALISAGLIIPALGWIACGKPNLGLAALAGAPTRKHALWMVGGGLATALASLVVDPDWPWQWREAILSSQHLTPLVARPLGWMMLAGLIAWRDPNARLLVGLSLVPQTGLFYDALPAMLVARTRLEAAALALITWVVWFSGPIWPAARNFSGISWVSGMQVLVGVMLPALGLVLWRWRRSTSPA